MVTVELTSNESLVVFTTVTIGWFAVCFAAAHFVRHETIRRMIWRMSLAGVLGLCVLESIGTPQWTYGRMSHAWRPAPKVELVTRHPIASPSIPFDANSQIINLPPLETHRPNPATRATFTAGPLANPLRRQPPTPSVPIPISTVMIGMWAGGTTLLLLYVASSHFLTWWFWMRRCQPASQSLINRIAGLTKNERGRPPNVFVNSRIGSPVAMGVIRSRIVVSSTFEADFDSHQQDAILTHELRHIRDNDPLWRLIASLACAFLWWQPMVWMARRRLQAATELVADEACFHLKGGPEALAESLVRLGKLWQSTPHLGMAAAKGRKSDLSRRVERLLNIQQPTQSSPLEAGALRTLLVTFFVFLVGTSGWSRGMGSLDLGEKEMTIHSTFRRSLLGTSLFLAFGLPTTADLFAGESEGDEKHIHAFQESKSAAKYLAQKKKSKNAWGNKHASFDDEENGRVELEAETRELVSRLEALAGDKAKEIQEIVKELVTIEKMKIKHEASRQMMHVERAHQERLHQELRQHHRALEQKQLAIAKVHAERERRQQHFGGRDASDRFGGHHQRSEMTAQRFDDVYRKPVREVEERMSRLEKHFEEIHEVLHHLARQIEDRHRTSEDRERHRDDDRGRHDNDDDHRDEHHDEDHDHSNDRNLFDR